MTITTKIFGIKVTANTTSLKIEEVSLQNKNKNTQQFNKIVKQCLHGAYTTTPRFWLQVYQGKLYHNLDVIDSAQRLPVAWAN